MLDISTFPSTANFNLDGIIKKKKTKKIIYYFLRKTIITLFSKRIVLFAEFATAHFAVSLAAVTFVCKRIILAFALLNSFSIGKSCHNFWRSIEETRMKWLPEGGFSANVNKWIINITDCWCTRRRHWSCCCCKPLEIHEQNTHFEFNGFIKISIVSHFDLFLHLKNKTSTKSHEIEFDFVQFEPTENQIRKSDCIRLCCCFAHSLCLHRRFKSKIIRLS